jgi:hypothetical protein
VTGDLHCVTRWSKYDVEFSGVLLSDLLAKVKPTADAHFISFIARSERNHSTSLPLDVALDLATLIALKANGETLEQGHGGPIRNIVPRKYLYKSVKWLREIEFLTEDRLGYWEAETGYHNGADPWREERYMAPTIDRRTAARLLASKDFSHQDLRSIDASKRNLDRLNAESALLRDADLNDCSLEGANFNRANLSNAHLRNANLKHATLIDADLEGADLAGADLRFADLTRCSLIGSSFGDVDPETGEISHAAIVDETTQISLESIKPLTDDQFQNLKARLGLPPQ